ncbi:response regulator [Rheinheimera fenheensis]|uniref:response regulator n=1 Tax=Rheinheimera fenheensis TaxID=3152295 RepID=UPI00325F690D
MNLDYKILWIEDDSDFIDSLNKDVFINHINSEGFTPDVTYRVNHEDIISRVDGEKYDLIVVDYNITEDGISGGDVIRSIRDDSSLTEVIFYSGNSITKLREIAADKELEGVFFSSRDNDALPRKVCDVFDLTVRKVLDINNMRGIVMAEVADLDHQLSDLIQQIYLTLGEESRPIHHRKMFMRIVPDVRAIKSLVDDDCSDINKLIKEIKKKLDVINLKDLAQLIGSRSFDSSKRVESLVGLCKLNEVLNNERQLLDNIKNTLLWRNALAHQRPLLVDGQWQFTLKEGQNEFFNQEQARLLRHKLQEHRNLLRDISSKIMAG